MITGKRKAKPTANYSKSPVTGRKNRRFAMVRKSHESPVPTMIAALKEKKDPDSEWKEYYACFSQNITDKYDTYFIYAYLAGDIFFFHLIILTKQKMIIHLMAKIY